MQIFPVRDATLRSYEITVGQLNKVIDEIKRHDAEPPSHAQAHEPTTLSP